MTTTDNKEDSGWSSASACKKVLKLDGYAAVLSCSDPVCAPASFFVTDDVLLIVMEGTLRFRYGAAQYTAESNQIILLKSDIQVERLADPEAAGNVRYIMIRLKRDLLKEFIKLAPLAGLRSKDASPVTVSFVDARLSICINSLESYLDDAGRIGEHLTRIKLFELLFILAQGDNDILSHLMDLRPHFRVDITATVEDNVMNAISLPQLAVLAGRSLSSFKRDFTAIYNMPPSTWMRQRRLEKARELLASTTMNVTDVCYTLGFQNLAHFSRLFKSYFGYSPSRSRAVRVQVAGER